MASTVYLQADPLFVPAQPVVLRIYKAFTQEGADVATTVVAADQFTATIPATLPIDLDEGYTVEWVDNDGLIMPGEYLFFWDGTNIVSPFVFNIG